MSTPGTMTTAPSNARILAAVPNSAKLSKLPDSTGRGLITTNKKAMPPNHICGEHQESLETGYNGAQLLAPTYITPTSHHLTLTERGDKRTIIHYLALAPRFQVQTNQHLASQSFLHKEDQPSTTPKMTLALANWHDSSLNQVVLEIPDLTTMQWQELHHFHSCNTIWLFPRLPSLPQPLFQRNLSSCGHYCNQHWTHPGSKRMPGMTNWMVLFRQLTIAIFNQHFGSSHCFSMVPISPRHCGIQQAIIRQFLSHEASICNALVHHHEPPLPNPFQPINQVH